VSHITLALRGCRPAWSSGTEASARCELARSFVHRCLSRPRCACCSDCSRCRPKNKAKKKQGLGEAKTQQKTQAKALKKLKKESALPLPALACVVRTDDADNFRRLPPSAGEDDIDSILNELKKSDTARTTVTISDACAPPGPRCNASFTAHPTKDELILFGGE
jgi:hypothetical protein